MDVRFFGLCTVVAASLMAACGSPHDSPHGSAPAPAAGNAATAYELVLLEKPDSVDNYAKTYRAIYDLCVAAAQASHTTAKPFPQLPDTFGATRTTYLIRGRDRVVRHETFIRLDVSKETPDAQCEVDVVTKSSVDVDIVVGDTHTNIGSDESGHPLVQSEDISDLRRAESRFPVQSTARYTVPFTQNGVDMRCLPEGKPPLDGVQLQQMCVYTREGVLVEPDGKTIVLASRSKVTPNTPYVNVSEPQSLRIIEHPDPSLFSATTYTR